MCGIAGYFNSKPNKNFLEKAVKILNHRGPDSLGKFVSDHKYVGLAHNRLSIQDLSENGHQPMICEKEEVALVYNGEIYNTSFLKKKLEKKQFSFKGSSDTEVLLNLYLDSNRDKKSFVKLLRNLNGIFAFAIWDKSIETLWICRDNFGVKPLYYLAENNNFFFSSEAKLFKEILFKNDKKSHDYINQLDIQSILLYLKYTWCPGNTTPHIKIKSLNPGELLEIKDCKISSITNWVDQSHLKIKANKPKFIKACYQNFHKPKKLIDQLDYKLRESVKKQMLSDVEVGAFLSGGLDSSCIVNYAREINPDLKCFTINIKNASADGFADDLIFARKVAKHFNVKLEEVTITSDDFIDKLPYIISQLDEPIADPAALNTFFITKLAREKGIKVLLSGTGSDDIFTGYRRHQALYINNLFNLLPNQIWGFSSKLISTFNMKNPNIRRIHKFIESQDKDPKQRILNFLQKYPKAIVMKVLNKEYIDLIEYLNKVDPIEEFVNSLPNYLDEIHKSLALEQRFYLNNLNLNYMDKMSMANGVEVRVPFLENDLVDFVYKIPTAHKLRFLETKWILKKTMEKYLPKNIIYRPKTGFGVPLNYWVRNEMREYIDHILSFENINSRGIFNPREVRKIIELNCQGKIEMSYFILSLLSIEIWLKEYFG